MKNARLFGLMKDPITKKQISRLERDLEYLGIDGLIVNIMPIDDQKEDKGIIRVNLKDGYTLHLKGIMFSWEDGYFSKDNIRIEDLKGKTTKVKRLDQIIPTFEKLLKNHISTKRIASKYLRKMK